MHAFESGYGRPLLLIHGLGGSWRSWTPVLQPLAAERKLIAVDLPGFGESRPLHGEVSIATLADALIGFLAARGLLGIDAVGSSMGARLALELARRGVIGACVALDPGGFWQGWERRYFHRSMQTWIALVRALQRPMPRLMRSPWGRRLLLSQLSARPTALDAELALAEMRSQADALSFDALLRSLVFGPPQPGLAAGTGRGPLVIGWGRQDRLCLPRQAARALQRFPGAQLHWFERCGHFPHWDQPQQAVRLILEATAPRPRAPGPAARAGAPSAAPARADAVRNPRGRTEAG